VCSGLRKVIGGGLRPFDPLHHFRLLYPSSFHNALPSHAHSALPVKTVKDDGKSCQRKMALSSRNPFNIPQKSIRKIRTFSQSTRNPFSLQGLSRLERATFLPGPNASGRALTGPARALAPQPARSGRIFAPPRLLLLFLFLLHRAAEGTFRMKSGSNAPEASPVSSSAPVGLMSCRRVAQLCDLSLRHVYRLIHQGDLEAVRIGRRHIRITRESYNALLARWCNQQPAYPNDTDDLHSQDGTWRSRRKKRGSVRRGTTRPRPNGGA